MTTVEIKLFRLSILFLDNLNWSECSDILIKN